MNTRVFIIQVFLFISIAKLHAQEIRFEHFTTEQGLSNSIINCVLQDKKGFIWIGTDDGLNKFDGYTFTVYKNIADDSNSLSDNKINQIFEDHLNRLWIATNDGGLDLLNRETNKVEHFLSTSDDKNSLMNNNIVYMFEDSRQNFWVMSSNTGLNLYQPETNDFKRVPLPINGNTRELPAPLVYEDKEYNFWIAGNTGLVMYSPVTGEIQKFVPRPNEKSDLANRVTMVVPKTDSSLYVSVVDILFEFDVINKRFVTINNNLSKYHAEFQTLFMKNDSSDLWFGTYNGGLIKYNKITDTFTKYLHSNSNPTSLSGDIVNTIYKDRSGNMWVGTYMQGLNKFDRNLKFNSYLDGQIVCSFFDNGDDNSWIGTQTSGLYLHHKKTDKWTNFQSKPNDPNSLSYNSINSVYQDKKNVLWVGTWEHGVNRADVSSLKNGNLKFEHLLGNESVISIAEDSKNRMWLGTNNSLYLYNSKNHQFINFVDEPHFPKSFGNASVQAIATDSDGDLWLCTWNGLHHVILPENEEPTLENVIVDSYYNDPNNENSLSDNRVLSICISANGTIWVGTYARGINKIEVDKNDKSKFKCTYYTQNDGLPSNCVFGIQEDEKGLLWISTNKGFSSFDPTLNTFVKYDKNDGLQGEDFYWRSSFKSPLGLMYFGGSNGYNSFLPGEIQVNKSKPPVVITGFSIFNEPVVAGEPNSPLKTDISTTSEITIHHDQSMISFDYAALNYILTYKNRYKYKMDGFDKDWVNAGDQRRATYTNLDPGVYTFRVIASNNDGIWNDQGATIKLTILPPIWKTWWFRLLMGALVIASLLAFYEWRIRSLKRQKKRIEQIVKDKTIELHLQKEDLQAFNEELTASNEQLYRQRIEMESLNEELTSSNEELEVTLQSLKEAQNQLIHSEKMASLGVLSAGIAHEINNPLNFIYGGVTFLESYIKEHCPEKLEEIQSVLDGINTGVERAVVIVKSLNQYNRSDELPFTNCNIHSIIDNCLLMLQNQYKNRIEVQRLYTDHHLVIDGNDGKLHQAFLNILANAGQAISDKGTVTIETSIADEIMQIVITDNGHGISSDNLKKIFDPFFTTKDPGKGTGLGLAITYKLIQEHNGTIEFESQIGVGTKVCIKFLR